MARLEALGLRTEAFGCPIPHCIPAGAGQCHSGPPSDGYHLGQPLLTGLAYFFLPDPASHPCPMLSDVTKMACSPAPEEVLPGAVFQQCFYFFGPSHVEL